MREIDTETPVVWPAWCYSGEAVSDDSSQTACSPAARGATRQGAKTKRKADTAPLDKLLTDRMLSMADAKKLCDSSNMFFEKFKSDINSDLIKSVELTVNNNNTIKSERLSPSNGEVQSAISRSRSATPSPFPGTSPQPHLNELASNQGIPNSIMTSSHHQQPRPEMQARNYSDFMRNLAAKYNNSNPNESANVKSNLFLESRFGINSVKPTKEPVSMMDNKRQGSPVSQVQVQVQNSNTNLMSSLFPGIPFSSAVFPPLIDMSSTQALVTLARAAKEAEIQQLLKTTTATSVTAKRSNLSPRNTPPNVTISIPSHLSQNPRNTNFTSYYQPATTLSIATTNMSLQHQQPSNPSPPTTSNTLNSHNKSSSIENLASPLDLSSTPMIKRMKIESPTPSSESGGSPAASSQQQQQQQQRANNQSICRTPTGSHFKCQAQSDEINSWNVEQVCDFVTSIDICAEYAQNFREQSIDGTGLPLLTEEHLTNSLSMKLGPALKLRSILNKKLGGPCQCVSCSATSATASSNQQTSVASPYSGNIPRPSSTDADC